MRRSLVLIPLFLLVLSMVGVARGQTTIIDFIRFQLHADQTITVVATPDVPTVLRAPFQSEPMHPEGHNFDTRITIDNHAGNQAQYFRDSDLHSTSPFGALTFIYNVSTSGNFVGLGAPGIPAYAESSRISLAVGPGLTAQDVMGDLTTGTQITFYFRELNGTITTFNTVRFTGNTCYSFIPVGLRMSQITCLEPMAVTATLVSTSWSERVDIPQRSPPLVDHFPMEASDRANLITKILDYHSRPENYYEAYIEIIMNPDVEFDPSIQPPGVDPVSYTHLTLPTIYSV